MKVIIVGGVAGGASTAARLRRLDENAEIIIFEKGKHISFANCGIPYYCGDVIKDREKLLLLTPAQIDAMFNIEARVEAEVIKINREKKTVTVLDKQSDIEYEETYDKLVLSPGASPLKPNIPGINDERIFTVRNVPDADAIKNYIRKNNVKNAVIVGGGFIGLEMVENLKHLGIKISLVEGATQVLAPVDSEIAAQIHNHLREKDVNLYIFDGVKSFETDRDLTINLYSGKQIKTDLVILAIGVKPESKFAKNRNVGGRVQIHSFVHAGFFSSHDSASENFRISGKARFARGTGIGKGEVYGIELRKGRTYRKGGDEPAKGAERTGSSDPDGSPSGMEGDQRR